MRTNISEEKHENDSDGLVAAVTFTSSPAMLEVRLSREGPPEEFRVANGRPRCVRVAGEREYTRK